MSRSVSRSNVLIDRITRCPIARHWPEIFKNSGQRMLMISQDYKILWVNKSQGHLVGVLDLNKGLINLNWKWWHRTWIVEKQEILTVLEQHTGISIWEALKICNILGKRFCRIIKSGTSIKSPVYQCILKFKNSSMGQVLSTLKYWLYGK